MKHHSVWLPSLSADCSVDTVRRPVSVSSRDATYSIGQINRQRDR